MRSLTDEVIPPAPVRVFRVLAIDYCVGLTGAFRLA